MPYLIVANASAGSDDDLPRRAATRLKDAEVLTLDENVDLGARVAEAIAERRTLVACGGDGTVNALVQHVAGTEGTLGVLPGGTLNHFARDLGVDEPDAALDALDAHEVRRVDVGRVNGRAFVNNIALGLYPELVRERERRQDRLGKWVALAVAAGKVLRVADPVVGTIRADGDRRGLDATLIVIGNNRYSTTPGSLGTRERLDEGVLDVRIVRSRSGARARSQLALRVLRARFPRRFVRTDARAVQIELDAARPLAIDGEQDESADRFEISIEPAALQVITPLFT